MLVVDKSPNLFKSTLEVDSNGRKIKLPIEISGFLFELISENTRCDLGLASYLQQKLQLIFDRGLGAQYDDYLRNQIATELLPEIFVSSYNPLDQLIIPVRRITVQGLTFEIEDAYFIAAAEYAMSTPQRAEALIVTLITPVVSHRFAIKKDSLDDLVKSQIHNYFSEINHYL